MTILQYPLIAHDGRLACLDQEPLALLQFLAMTADLTQGEWVHAPFVYNPCDTVAPRFSDQLLSRLKEHIEKMLTVDSGLAVRVELIPDAQCPPIVARLKIDGPPAARAWQVIIPIEQTEGQFLMNLTNAEIKEFE